MLHEQLSKVILVHHRPNTRILVMCCTLYTINGAFYPNTTTAYLPLVYHNRTV